MKSFDKNKKNSVASMVMLGLATAAGLGAYGNVYASQGDILNKKEQSEITINFDSDIKGINISEIQSGNRLVIEFNGLLKDKEGAINLLLKNSNVSNVTISEGDNSTGFLIKFKTPVHYDVSTEKTKGVLKFYEAGEFKNVNSSASGDNGNLTVLGGKVSIEKIEKIPTIESVANQTVFGQSASNDINEIVEVDVANNEVIEAAKLNKNTGFKESVNKIQVNNQSIKEVLNGLNFKNVGQNGVLSLEISSGKEPKIVKNGNLLVIDLPNIDVGLEFQKNIAVNQMGTPVRNLDVASQGGNGRITLTQLGDDWTFSAYQTNEKFTIEVKPVLLDETIRKSYVGKPLSLNFQNMDVRAVLQVIADFTGLNIIASDSVSGSMTVRLKDVPWDQALDLVLEARNLQKERNGNVVWVATSQEITERNKSRIELKNQNATLAPLVLKFFSLNHYKASDMKKILEEENGSSTNGAATQTNRRTFLSDRGTVGLDERNNAIFVQDTVDNLQEVERIIKRLDQAAKQVLIEAKLVVVDDRFSRELGSKFGVALRNKNNSTDLGTGNLTPGISNGYTDGVVPPLGGTNSNWNSSVTGGGSIGFTILNAAMGNALNFELSALEEKKQGKVISSPKLLTTNNRKAEIKQGTEIPYVKPSSNDSPATISFKSAVLKLDVTPQVSPNGRVTMDLDITKDTIGQLVNVQGGGQVPSINTRQMTTQVTVNDGQTVVLGGIYEVTNREDISKVPLFGDIPWIGNLFKHKNNSTEKVELLVFITPRVVTDSDLDNISSSDDNSVAEVNIKRR